VLEEDVSGSMQDQYVWSPVYIDGLIERDTPTQRMYVQQDMDFNVTALVDTSGNVQERYVYDPYGAVTILAPNWTTRGSSNYGWIYLHQGGRLDTATGLYSFRNRDFSPTLGRWIENDPLGFGAGDSNLYGYLRNDPTALTDPSGLRGIDPTGTILWYPLELWGFLGMGPILAPLPARGDPANLGPQLNIQSLSRLEAGFGVAPSFTSGGDGGSRVQLAIFAGQQAFSRYIPSDRGQITVVVSYVAMQDVDSVRTSVKQAALSGDPQRIKFMLQLLRETGQIGPAEEALLQNSLRELATKRATAAIREEAKALWEKRDGSAN
jgi:RHS repeat-associated protein